MFIYSIYYILGTGCAPYSWPHQWSGLGWFAGCPQAEKSLGQMAGSQAAANSGYDKMMSSNTHTLCDAIQIYSGCNLCKMM